MVANQSYMVDTLLNLGTIHYLYQAYVSSSDPPQIQPLILLLAPPSFYSPKSKCFSAQAHHLIHPLYIPYCLYYGYTQRPCTLHMGCCQAILDPTFVFLLFLITN